MNPNNESLDERCRVCEEIVPSGRLPLVCAGCGCALHPSCATVVERGPGWGNRTIFCAVCAGERPDERTQATP